MVQTTLSPLAKMPPSCCWPTLRIAKLAPPLKNYYLGLCKVIHSGWSEAENCKLGPHPELAPSLRFADIARAICPGGGYIKFGLVYLTKV